MFRLVVGLILALTVGWKIALGLTNNQGGHDDFKPVLIDFLVRQHFAVFDANDTGGVDAIAGDCRLRKSPGRSESGNRTLLRTSQLPMTTLSSCIARRFMRICRRGLSSPISTGQTFCAKSNLNSLSRAQSSLSLPQGVAMLNDCPGTNC